MQLLIGPLFVYCDCSGGNSLLTFFDRDISDSYYSESPFPPPGTPLRRVQTLSTSISSSSYMDPAVAHEEALRYLSNERFHRRFTLPATADHGELTVSYSDVGRMPDAAATGSNHPTILFMPGMFASRYLGVSFHEIAHKLGVRVLIVDRFGMGHTTDVPLNQRISIWIELVPLLLAHLGIQHVALGSHSAGTLYMLNTLAHWRDILDPENPLVISLAPWVNPSCSHVTSMQMAQYLPVQAFSIWDRIPRFFMVDAAPVVGMSGTIFTKVSNLMSSGASAGSAELSVQERNYQRIRDFYDMPTDLQAELSTVVFETMFNENTTGANSEALQCLRKGPNWTWDKCDDYKEFVKEVVRVERERGSSPKLKVRVFFAETDAMIGLKGRSYFEECWRGPEGAGYADVLDFEAVTVDDVDHDSLVRCVQNLERIFVEAGGTMPPSTSEGTN